MYYDTKKNKNEIPSLCAEERNRTENLKKTQYSECLKEHESFFSKSPSHSFIS